MRYRIIVVWIICIAALLLSNSAAAISDGLLKRPRAAWEYNKDAKATDVDHLGQGWDALYSAVRASGNKKLYYYKVAEGEFKYALRNFEQQKTKISREERYALKGLAELAFQTKNIFLAVPYYEKQLVREPGSVYFRYQYAKYLERFNKLTEAIKLIVAAIEVSPKKYKSKLHNYLGLLYVKDEQYDLAKSEVEKAEKLGGVNTKKLRRELQEHSQ